MYFDGNESDEHIEAKKKLFSLILAKRVKLVDSNGKSYDIFTGIYEDEFLHMESFMMDYSAKVLFSSRDSPCKKYMSEHGKSPLCNMKGYYGAFEELPCEKCVTDNFRKHLDGSSKFASYRPDISFGYEGIHRIWIEIKYTHGCSNSKITFCQEKGIVLLEASAESVLSLNDYHNKLTLNKLNNDNVVVSDKYLYGDAAQKIRKFLDERGYITFTALHEIAEGCSDGTHEWRVNKRKLVYDSNLVELNNYNSGVKDHLKLIKSPKIYIEKSNEDRIRKVGEMYDSNIEGKVKATVKKMSKIINKKGYMLLKDYKESIVDILPPGHKSKLKQYELGLDLFQVRVYKDIKEELNRLNVNVKVHKNGIRAKVILSDKLYKNINLE